MERSHMETSIQSAGLPGAPRCSEGQQASAPPMDGRMVAARALFMTLASDLASVRGEVEAMIEEGQGGTRAVSLLALVCQLGQMADQAQVALGGSLISNRWRAFDDDALRQLGGVQ